MRNTNTESDQPEDRINQLIQALELAAAYGWTGKFISADDARAVAADLRSLSASKQAVERENEALRLALQPFADLADVIEDASDLVDDPDRRDHINIGFGGMTLGDMEVSDFNAARALLTPTGVEGDQGDMDSRSQPLGDASALPADDWVDWKGGENPAPGKRVEIRLYEGAQYEDDSDDVCWAATGSKYDVTSYRILTPTPPSLQASGSGGEG